MERKLTYDEITKALECCLLSNEQQEERCAECPMYESIPTICQNILAYHALDLINRQKAEIDALIAGQETLQKNLPKVIKAEAIKEFAERLKKDFKKSYFCNSKYVVVQINRLVKEMTEAADGKL